MEATGRLPMGKKRRYDCAVSSEIASIHNDNITFLTRILIVIKPCPYDDYRNSLNNCAKLTNFELIYCKYRSLYYIKSLILPRDLVSP
jgi:hypothetical protein